MCVLRSEREREKALENKDPLKKIKLYTNTKFSTNVYRLSYIMNLLSDRSPCVTSVVKKYLIETVHTIAITEII